MKTSRTNLTNLQRRVTLAFALMLLLAALAIVDLALNIRKRAAAERLETHTLLVMSSLDTALTLAVDLETGMRGYIYSGIDSYLQPYIDARALLPGTLDRLGVLMEDNPSQRRRLQELRALIDSQLVVRTEVIDLARSKGLDAARSRAVSAGLKQGMDAVRAGVRSMRMEEDRLLQSRHARTARLDLWSLLSLAFFTLIGVGALGSSYSQVRRFLTARMHAEREAQESAQNLSVTLRSIGDGVLATDIDGKVTRLNPVAERLTGWSEEDAQGRSVHEVFRIVNEVSRERVTVPIDHVLRTDTVADLANHTVLLSRGGEEFPIADSAAPIRDEEGNLLGAVLVFRDITADRLAARKLEASEQLNRGVVEMAPYTLYLQTEGRIRWINPAGQEMFRGDNDLLVGREVVDFISPECRDVVSDHLRVVTDKSATAPPIETRLLRRDGSRFWGRIAASPIVTQGQRGAVVIVEDITARREARENADASEVQLRAISDNLPEGAVFQFRMDEGGARFSYLSSGIKTLTEFSAEELTADCERLLSLVEEEDAVEFRNAARGSIARLQQLDHTVRVRTGSGVVRWLHCRAAANRRPAGALEWNGVVTDVTAARLVKQQLRLINSELEQRVNQRVQEIRRFRAAMDNSPDSLFLVDRRSMRFVDVNLTSCLVLGYSREQLLGMGPQDVHPISREALEKQFDEVARLKDLASALDTICCCSDGSQFPAEVLIRPLEGDNGILIAIARDVTAHKAVIESLKRRELQLNAAQSMAHIGSWEWDTASGETRWSEEMYSIYGIHPGHPAPGYEDAPRFYSGEDWGKLNDAVQETLRTGKPYILELEVIRPDGTRRWTISRGAPAGTSSGPSQLFGTIQDITDRRQLEGQLQQAHKMEAIGRLAGGIAHDFNNLLTVINGYSEMLLARLQPEDPVLQKLTYIRNAGSQAAQLTQQLLAFSRKQIIQPRTLNLNSVVRELEPMLRRVMGEHIEITTTLFENLASILADSGQIGQILMNLAANAGSAMPDGGRFSIETQNADLTPGYALMRPQVPAGGFVQLTVSDTGTGMDEHTKAHLFEPFFTTREAGKGTGLGLATVYGIVKQSGGFIWVYSEPGEGTTFKVYLPRLEAECSTARQVAAPSAEGGGETVLIVEDQEDLRLLAYEILRSIGYKVLTAANGELALEVANRTAGPIALLLTDVVMPGIGVRELVERIQLGHPETRVLYMSGYTEDAVVRRGISEANDAFIQKPFSPNILALRVREIIDS